HPEHGHSPRNLSLGELGIRLQRRLACQGPDVETESEVAFDERLVHPGAQHIEPVQPRFRPPATSVGAGADHVCCRPGRLNRCHHPPVNAHTGGNHTWTLRSRLTDPMRACPMSSVDRPYSLIMIVREWRRYLPAVLAVAFSDLLITVQV